jgi:Glycolipid transfer protein (GLTP)
MTFFDTIPSSFVDVPVKDSQIETVPFLDSVEVLAKLMESLGSAFSVVKNDMQGNVDKIRLRYLNLIQTQEQHGSLGNFAVEWGNARELVKAERAEKKAVAIGANTYPRRSAVA